jgi:type II secretion system protein D
VRHHGFLAVVLAGTAATTCWLLNHNDQLDASEEQFGSYREAYRGEQNAPAPVKEADGIRLSYFDAPWDRVLRDVAKQGQLTLVMDKIPHGRYARRDRNHYEVESAVRILNADLEQQGFRLIRQNNFLIVLHLDKARTRYARPTVSETPSSAYPRTSAAGTREAEFPQRNVRPVSGGFAQEPSTFQFGNRIQQASQTTDASQDADVVRPQAAGGQQAIRANAEQQLEDSAEPVVRNVRVLHTKAADLARTIYLVFESRAELVKEGLQGLPTFVVNPPGEVGPNTRPVFRIGIDQENNQLLIEATVSRANHLSGLVAELDKPLDADDDETVRLLPNKGVGNATARDLNDQIHRLVAMRAQQDPAAGQAGAEPPAADGTESLNLRGEVNVQAMQDLGILMLTGNEADVDKVAAIINQLEQMSIGSLPDIHLLSLNHVNSEALSELLSSVYERLSELRQRGSTERQTVAFFPVVQPNAILILAPDLEMDSILQLADELDKELDPESEFRVFDLQNAVASQVVTQLDTLYDGADGQGLRTRVRSIADVRTNSVIVQGRSRDIAEVAKLIERIDRDSPGAVHRVQVVPLNHATAEELSEVINGAIQAVSSPPQQTTGGGGGFGGFGAGGANQAPQELRDGKSVALEFLASDGNAQRLIRSGILADVRINPDVRTNSLIISAPEASMSLMLALIRELDRSPSAVATIKVFSLKNADAEQSVNLLTTLFENQNQEDQLGVQIAGAEDSSSSLIPLQFSADIRTNTVLAVGSEESLAVVEAILLRLDNDDTRQRTTTVIQLRNSPAELVAASINTFLEQQQALQDSTDDLLSNIERLRQEVIVTEDTNSNSLIVSASPEYYSQIVSIINELDATPPQVIIQALLVEVQLDNTDEFGVELGFQDPLLFRRSIIETVDDIVTVTQTTTQNNTQTTNQTVISQNPTPGFLFNNTNSPLGNNVNTTNTSLVGTQGISNFSLGRQNSDLGFGGFVFSAQSDAVSVLIRALAARRTVHVLSRPQIRTTHNNLASIQVGQEVPVVNGVTINESIVTPTIEQRNTGIILEVTPRITPDGTIAMEVYAEKSALSAAGVPVFTDATTGNTIESQIREVSIADTTVSVPNGQTIVIGGMITKADETLERKVPWLGDLPIVGRAFRYDGTTTSRTELLIFLTPRIVFNDIDSELIKQIEAERIHFVESEAEEIHGPLYSVPPSGMNGVPQEMYPGEEVYPGVPPQPSEYPAQSSRQQPAGRAAEAAVFEDWKSEGGVRSSREAGPAIQPASAARTEFEDWKSESSVRSADFQPSADRSGEAEKKRESWIRQMMNRKGKDE